MSSTEYRADAKDIHFILTECFQIGTLNQFAEFEDYDEETLDLLIQEGINFAENVIAPTSSEADRIGCVMKDGQAIAPECLRDPYLQAKELGWFGLHGKSEHGGQNVPYLAGAVIQELFIGASPGFFGYMGLTSGVATMIETFGSEDLQKRFVPKLRTGDFFGTMCLSEPHAGSDVGANSSSAQALGEGRYKIKGTKCWITGGDQDLSDNIVHTVLARVQGAPEGIKGLSLFVVPKYRVNDDGSKGEWNDVTLATVEHKMGYHSSATCVLNFGENQDCYGYLLGEENKGIVYMFQLMNEARIGSGLVGLGGASAAYQNALSYAKERVQGTHINEVQNPQASKVLIIEHPDVRFNLLGMKARVEAMRALLYGTSNLVDLERVAQTQEEKERLDSLVQILTPMCKGWCTEVGLDVARTGIQVLGGVGYTKDFPIERIYRDLRVATIYEGTTGIQALDLVGRKMTMKNGAFFMGVLKLFQEFVEEHEQHIALQESIQLWSESCEKVGEIAMKIQGLLGERGMAGAALYATPYLMFFSAVSAGYFLLQQGVTASQKLEHLKREHQITAENVTPFLQSNSEASFYDNKLKTIHFYMSAVLPTFESHIRPIERKVFDPLDVRL